MLVMTLNRLFQGAGLGRADIAARFVSKRVAQKALGGSIRQAVRASLILLRL